MCELRLWVGTPTITFTEGTNNSTRQSALMHAVRVRRPACKTKQPSSPARIQVIMLFHTYEYECTHVYKKKRKPPVRYRRYPYLRRRHLNRGQVKACSLFKMGGTLFEMSPGDGAALPPLFLGGRCGAVFTHFLVVRRRVHTKYGARGIIFWDATLTLDAVTLAGQQLTADHAGCSHEQNTNTVLNVNTFFCGRLLSAFVTSPGRA